MNIELLLMSEPEKTKISEAELNMLKKQPTLYKITLSREVKNNSRRVD